MSESLSYLVEPMTLDDIDQVMEIEQVSFSAPWSARAYRYEITTNQHSTMLVVRPAVGRASMIERWTRRLRGASPGPVLGYAGFWLLVDEAHICTIAVHPNWRRRGLGELLLLSLLEKGIALHAIRSTLEVRASNHAAQALYLKYGFEIVSRRKRYYTDNDEDAYIMATLPFASPEFQVLLNRCRTELYARLRAEGTPESSQANPTMPAAHETRAG
jgi:ribosomal-protein-alanine N-acetyltransferase